MNQIKLNKGDSAIIIRHLDKGFDVEIIEQSNQVGGLAKSIKINKNK